MSVRRKHLFGWALGAALLSLFLWVTLRFNPGRILSSCPLRVWTGVPCPTCGGTSALRALVDGDLFGALKANPLVASIGLLLPMSGIASLILLPWAKRLHVATRPPRFWIGVVLVLTLLNWIYLITRS